ncbi:MAG: pyrroline-5-carboxylate reductase [Gammaproteobacteria bacterium]|nr:MAG: pyrroline-5-carboxylate reductase [Gammaproteobacteria bacterium]
MTSISFIGGGNMAGSLIGGLINAGYDASKILITEPNKSRRQDLENQYQAHTSADNIDALKSETIILAVKPQRLKTICLQLKQQLVTRKNKNLLFISIAAGIRSTDINRWLGGDIAIVRCMPNTPALVQCGATGLYANPLVTKTQKQQAEQILQAVGIVTWVENEDLLNAVTAVSGSGPAYFFLMMEAMQHAGEKLGLSSEVTQRLVLQTALGAARMATESDVSAEELRKRVTSKGGTTEKAILSFQSANYQQIVLDALQAANDRSISLADELGSD